MATGDRLLSCGHDRNIKLWGLKLPNMDDGEDAIDATQDDVNKGTSRRGESMRLDETEEVKSLGKPLLIYPSKVPLKYVHVASTSKAAIAFASHHLD